MYNVYKSFDEPARKHATMIWLGVKQRFEL